MPRYLFTAKDSDGQPVTDFIESATLDGARYALETRRYTQILFHTDDASNQLDESIRQEMGSPNPEGVLTPRQILEARQSGGLLGGLWFGLRMNAVIWVPLAIWCVLALIAGRPYRWNDWLGFGLFGVFVVYFVWLALPGIGYDRLLVASVWNDERETRLWTSFLRALRRVGCPLVPALELDVRLAHVLGRHGRRPEVEALMAKHEAAAEQNPLVIGQIAGVFDSLGDHERAHQWRTRFCEVTQDSAMAVIDHAHALVRQMRRADEAEASLSRIGDREQSAIAILFITYTRGLIALERGRHAEALASFREAETGSLQFQNPLMVGMRNDIRAFQAIALAGTGAREEARRLKSAVLPLLQARNDRPLIQYLESAI